MTELERLKNQLAAIEGKPFSGVQSVRMGNDQVTYRTADEMIKLMEYMRSRIAELESGSLAGPVRYSLARFVCR